MRACEGGLSTGEEGERRRGAAGGVCTRSYGAEGRFMMNTTVVGYASSSCRQITVNTLCLGCKRLASLATMERKHW